MLISAWKRESGNMPKRKTTKIPEIVVTAPAKVEGEEAATNEPVTQQPQGSCSLTVPVS